MKTIKNIALIGTIVASIATIFGLAYQLTQSDKKTIEIKELTLEKLTDLPSVEGLKAKYTFKDSIVTSLWKLNYLITNLSEGPIIGEGNQKDIIKDKITFRVPDNFQILEVKKNDKNAPFIIRYDKSSIKVSFLQWISNESLDISIYVEQTSQGESPSLITNEREIIGGHIVYNSFQSGLDQSSRRLIDYFPNSMEVVLWWILIIINSLTIIGFPIILAAEVYKYIQYLKDKKVFDNYSFFDERKKTPPEKPETEWKTLIMTVIFLVLYSSIPLLWMIEI